MKKIFCGILAIFMFTMPLFSRAEGQAQSPADQDASSEHSSSWLDATHHYTTQSTDALANWVDQFFGVPRADIESAYSSLRLTFENEWEEGEGNSTNVRLRGKVHLPRVDERLSLVFADEDGDELETRSGIDSVADKNENSKLGLQYNASDQERSRLDFRAGLRSSGKAKVSSRYRYENPWGDRFINRFTETLYFIDGEGFGSRTQYDLDYLIDENRLVRWGNSAKFAEDNDGVEWSTRLVLAKRLDDRAAISYFTWTAGDTRPEYLTSSYGLGALYRQNFYRSWMFFELEPAYAWQKETVDESREGTFLFTARIEILFESLE
jgi:hypothetical protein